MATKRTPIAREAQHKITPAAIALFERMRQSRSEAAYDGARSDLIDELQLMPWEGILLDDPDELNPYPPGSVAAAHWDQRAARPEASTLFRALQEAAAAARVARKQNGAAAPAEAGAAPDLRGANRQNRHDRHLPGHGLGGRHGGR
jgi:hypothetical protein